MLSLTHGSKFAQVLILAATPRSNQKTVLSRDEFSQLYESAYRTLDRAGERILHGCQEICDRYSLPAYAVGVASKGCVMFSDEPVVDYRSYTEHFNDDLNYLGWLYHMVNGVYMTPGADEQWTLSVMHDDEVIDHYVEVFEQFAKDVTAGSVL